MRWLVVQAVGPYTFAGRRPLTLVPGPPLRPGLSLVGFAEVTPFALARRLPRVFGKGVARPKDTNVVVLDNVTSLRVTAAEPVAVQADGEFLASSTNVAIGTTDAALQLVIP